MPHPRGAEMTDTPGTPGETPASAHLVTAPHNRHIQPRATPTAGSTTSRALHNGLASGETPLDKPRSFRDDNKEHRYGATARSSPVSFGRVIRCTETSAVWLPAVAEPNSGSDRTAIRRRCGSEFGAISSRLGTRRSPRPSEPLRRDHRGWTDFGTNEQRDAPRPAVG